MTSIVDDAVNALERRRFFATFNEQYRRLRNDHDAWAGVEAERNLEASALSDRSSTDDLE